MEKGTRVQEIKKRFEGLNSQKNDSLVNKNSLCNISLGNASKSTINTVPIETSAVTKAIIKRSHAFRNDKSKVIKPLNLSIPDQNFTEIEKNQDLVLKNEFRIEKKYPDSASQDPKLKILGEKDNSTVKNGVENLSETLKKALKNPLPPGPAPKKPPRTFAHSGKSLELSNVDDFNKKIVSNKLSDSFLLNNDSSVSAKIAAFSRRSKTDPHIMLKKLESALLSNQVKDNSKVILSPKTSVTSLPIDNKQYGCFPNNTNSKLNKLCFNGLSSCLNKNIYETPFDCQSRKLLQNNSNLHKNNITYGTIKKIQNNSHIYEEPYSPKTERKNNNLVKNEVQSRPSLHYMSSPVRDSKRKIFSECVKSSELKSAFCCNDEEIKMITDAFNDNTKSDSDADSIQEEKGVLIGNREEVTAERKVYLKRVSSMRQQNIRLPRQGQNLFEVMLLIGIDQDLKLGKVPYVKYKFPESAVLPESLAELVFPDAEDWPPNVVTIFTYHNNYTLVLTMGDGARKYAYCRRLQPEGAPICLPLAYVLISSHRDNIFYYKVLAELEARHGMPESDTNHFVRSLYHSSIPKPGLSLQFNDIVIRRAVDPRLESYDISRVLQALTVPIFIKVFNTLLIERKVILVGSNISVVSDCIEGLLKAVFPFEWEHTLIGAVPSSMLELCTAPTPYLMGVIRPKKTPQPSNFLPLTCIEDCFVADVDSSEVIQCCGDESSILPTRLSSCLKSALYLCPVHNTDIGPSEALMRLFVELVGHYNSHVITDVHTNNRKFQRESFIKAPSSRSKQLFLDWFTETAMFQSFIQRRLERTFEPGLFEQRCAEYIEENIKNHNFKKERTLNKTVKTIGVRLKDWTSSS